LTDPVARYVPGDFTAALGRSLLVVWDARDAESTVDAVWAAVSGAGGVADVLSALSAEGGWLSLPAFALIAREPTAVRVLVRGDVEVRVTRCGGEPDVTVAAMSVTTWLESTVEDAGAITVLAGDAHRAASLPLVRGAVPVSRLVWSGEGEPLPAPCVPARSALPAEGRHSLPASGELPVSDRTEDPRTTTAAAGSAPSELLGGSRAEGPADSGPDAPAIVPAAAASGLAGVRGLYAALSRGLTAAAEDPAPADDPDSPPTRPDSPPTRSAASGPSALLADLPTGSAALEHTLLPLDDAAVPAEQENPTGTVGESVDPEADGTAQVAGSDRGPTRDPELSLSYQLLHGASERRSVGAAAIRVEEADPDAADEAASPGEAPAPSGDEPTTGDVPAPPGPGSSGPDSGTIPVLPSAAHSSPDTELISASPWSLSRPPAPATPAPSAPVAPWAAGVAGLTPGPDPAPGPGPEADRLGDHDERTVSRSALAGLAAAGGRPGPGRGPTVLSAMCPAGHPNPPSATRCRNCDVAVPAQEPVSVARPSLGRLRATVGGDVELDRPALIGRQPRRAGMVNGEMPQLVEVPNPEQDLSRAHVEVRIEDWQVWVVDLDSSNGTFVALPGRSPERLRAKEPTLIVPGSVIHLSREVTFTFEAP